MVWSHRLTFRYFPDFPGFCFFSRCVVQVVNVRPLRLGGHGYDKIRRSLCCNPLLRSVLRLILQFPPFFHATQDLAVITAADFQVLLDELLAYEAVGKLDAIVA